MRVHAPPHQRDELFHCAWKLKETESHGFTVSDEGIRATTGGLGPHCGTGPTSCWMCGEVLIQELFETALLYLTE